MTQKRTKATQRKSSSARKVGIEMLNHYLTDPARPSSSARKVGIEISSGDGAFKISLVVFR